MAAATRDLSVGAVAMADRLVAATPTCVDRVDLSRPVEETRLYHEPDRAACEEENAWPVAGSG